MLDEPRKLKREFTTIFQHEFSWPIQMPTVIRVICVNPKERREFWTK